MDVEEARALLEAEAKEMRDKLSLASPTQLKIIAACALYAFTEKEGPGIVGVVMAEILASLLLGFTTLNEHPDVLEEALQDIVSHIKAIMDTMSETPPPKLN